MAEADAVRRAGRPRRLTSVQDMAIAMARMDGVCWAALIEVYGMSRTALWCAAARGMALFHA